MGTEVRERLVGIGRQVLLRRGRQHDALDGDGRSVDALPWYQILATWKAAIFLEGSYGRFSAGTTTDPFFGNLETGVPALAALALERTRAV